MKNPFRFLKNNWLKYGFETAAIIVGILGAFALSTWHETRKEKDSEKEYLVNLLVDLEGNLSNIETQIEFEDDIRETCEEVLVLIKKDPYNIGQLNPKIANLGRRSFVLSSPVFEDLKFSGHLSIISESGLRQSIFRFYQYVNYVETVIASNNSNYVDKLSYQILNMSLADLGYEKNLTVGPLDLEYSLDVEPFSGAEKLILSQLENNEVRFNLHNLIVLRGRLSTLQISLLETLKAENLQLIKKLDEILKQ
jgi:hypothetical protein